MLPQRHPRGTANRLAVADLNRHSERHFGRRFSLRIGLHYGPLIVGDVGHRSKRQLTAMGDTVNVASRIEAHAKELGTTFLASWQAAAPVRKDVIHGKPVRARLRGQTLSHALVGITGIRSADAAFVVQATFARVMPEADIFARTFYQHLFRLDPSLCPMFATTDFAKRRRMLLNMIGVMVHGLDRFADRSDVARSRRATCRLRGYAGALRDFPSRLTPGVGKWPRRGFHQDVRHAWETVFGWLRDAMLGHTA